MDLQCDFHPEMESLVMVSVGIPVTLMIKVVVNISVELGIFTVFSFITLCNACNNSRSTGVGSPWSFLRKKLEIREDRWLAWSYSQDIVVFSSIQGHELGPWTLLLFKYFWIPSSRTSFRTNFPPPGCQWCQFWTPSFVQGGPQFVHPGNLPDSSWWS